MSLDYTHKKAILDQYQETKKAEMQDQLQKKIAGLMNNTNIANNSNVNQIPTTAAEGGEQTSREI
jgi:hypothetical protein